MQAFPSAYGWGAESVGGRGGKIIFVTNLSDSGPGSLRAACEAFGARIVVFLVAGYIDLLDDIRISNPYITIPGQTAPGGGISILNFPFAFLTHNIIMQYVRSRGDDNGSPGQGKGMLFYMRGAHDIMVDHCSSAWNSDDNDVFYNNAIQGPIYNVTIQNHVFTEPSPSHHTSLLVASDLGPGNDNIRRVSIHNSFFGHSGHRNAAIQAKETEFLNNVIYNWTGPATQAQRSFDGIEGPEIDLANNYYLKGAQSGNAYILHDWKNYGPDKDNPPASLYVNGNIAPDIGINSESDENWVLPFVLNNTWDDLPDEGTHRRLTRLAQPTYPVPLVAAITAKDRVIVEAGAHQRLNADGSWADNRDSHDEEEIQEFIDNSGPGSSTPTPPASYPTLNPGTPYPDSNNDGIPDGYTGTLEEFLNGPTGGPTMSVVDDLLVVEAALRAEAAAIVAQADAVAQSIADLQAVDDVLDAAADVIEAD